MKATIKKASLISILAIFSTNAFSLTDVFQVQCGWRLQNPSNSQEFIEGMGEGVYSDLPSAGIHALNDCSRKKRELNSSWTCRLYGCH